MSRIINEPVIVHIDKNSSLSAFIWRKRLYRIVNILSWWREPSAWWEDKTVSLFVRVAALCGEEGIYEICRQKSGWFLYRLID